MPTKKITTRVPLLLLILLAVFPFAGNAQSRKDTDMNTVRVRYMVNDLDPAVAFYIKYLGLQVKQQAKPNFAMLSSTYSVITQSSQARRPAARPVAQADSLSSCQKNPAPGNALSCKTKQSAVPPNIARRVLHSRRGAMILVTGASGTVGAELVKRLSERGTPARAFVRNRAQAHATALPGIEIIEGDFHETGNIHARSGGSRTPLLADTFVLPG
jgi:hypothetical protein